MYEAPSCECGEKTGTIPAQCNGNRLFITHNLGLLVQAYDCVIKPCGGLKYARGGVGRRVRHILSDTADKPAVEGIADVYNRTYFTRAWIFQEILLSGSRGNIICGRHQCDWNTMEKALISFSCSDLHGILLKSFTLLKILECEDTVDEIGGLELQDLSDVRRYLKATDPRGKICATLGVLRL